LPFGSHLAEDQVVVTSILQDPLRFPANYHDDSGRTLIHAMLQKAPDQRCLAVSGLHDWAHVKASPFFGGNNLFSKLLTRQLRPPIVPIAEEYMPEDELCDVGLSDAEELGGEAEWVVDNRWLRAGTCGIAYRRTKALEDWDFNTEPAAWGQHLLGLDCGDGWLAVGSRYLPMRVRNQPVLTMRRYLADNAQLQAETDGIVYRRSKQLDDRDTNATTAHPHWGDLVAGADEGDGWLRVADRYLPMEVDGIKVLAPILAVGNEPEFSDVAVPIAWDGGM